MELVETTYAGISYLHVPEWTASGIFHGFIGRDLDVKEHTEGWYAGFGRGNNLALLKQIHGRDIAVYRGNPAPSEIPEADAWLAETATETLPCALGIKTADCFPVLLMSRKPFLVAAAHCGWRGAVQDLLGETIAQLIARGASPATIELAIGPGAQACCYEISADVAEEFYRADAKAWQACSNTAAAQIAGRPEVVIRAGNSLFSDIRRLLINQATSCGVVPAHIAATDACTICNSRFFSFRREKEYSGRQLSFISTAVAQKVS